MAKYYPIEIQKLFFYFLINDDYLLAKCLPLIKKEYFHQDLRKSVEFTILYLNKYKQIPPKELLKIETNFDFSDEPSIQTLTSHKNWFLEEFEKFLKHQALTNAILNSVEKINKEEYDAIEKNIKDALTISLNMNLGTNYFEDPSQRLLRLKDRTNIVSTGWKDLDSKLFGGFGRGQINIFAGNSGTGKSLFLQNISVNWILKKMNVVYFTFELSEDLVSLRLDAMLTNKTTKEILKNVNDVSILIKEKSKDAGKLTIKYMPIGTTSNNLYSYLKEYFISNGFLPDAIIVDYLDLMHPNEKSTSKSDLFIKDKYVTEELRSLVVDLNLLCCTASQLNRSAVEEDEHNMSHIAGGISKINTADNVMTIYTNNAMKKNGLYRIQFIKTRSSSGVGSSIELNYNPSTMRITDKESKETNTIEEDETTKKVLISELKKLNKNIKVK